MDIKTAKQIKFPLLSQELINLYQLDQIEIKDNFNRIANIKSKRQRDGEFAKIKMHTIERAKRMLEILDYIHEPTVDNIGIKGSEALALIALHSNFQIMRKVLKKYENSYEVDPKSVYYGLIPSLTDRLSIYEIRKQVFGTHWLMDTKGTPYFVEVTNFEKMNINRKKYGLPPVRRPVNLAVDAEKYPLGRGLAVITDQKKLTEAEYKDFIWQYMEFK